MKHLSHLTKLAILPLLFIALIAKADDEIGVTGTSMSTCKDRDYAQTRSAAPEEGEWIDYSVEKREDGYYIHVVHENVYFNCGTKETTCTATIKDNVITTDERAKQSVAFACICPFDVTYDVGPLQPGEYTLIITLYGTTKLAEIKINVGEPAQGRFNVDDYVTKIEATLPPVPAEEAIYDLLGRRYKKFPYPGVFVKGGKKVLWKGE